MDKARCNTFFQTLLQMSKISTEIQKQLLTCSHLLAAKARLTLLTLLILMGVTWGLWLARPSGVGESEGVGTRSGGITALCKHASIAFLPSLSIQHVSQLMRAEDAHILYGPDEFGEYQLRFSSHIAVPAAIARLQSQSGVIDVVPNPDCL